MHLELEPEKKENEEEEDEEVIEDDDVENMSFDSDGKLKPRR